MKKYNNRCLAAVLILLSSLIILSIVYGTFFSPGATGNDSFTIKDAFCDNDSWASYFIFTIVNAQSSDANLTYTWHLDDPKAQQPKCGQDISGAFTDYYYIGHGSIIVPGNNSTIVVVPITPDPWYPLNNLVMDVELFNGNKSICHYREQKSPYGWDYSSLPPTKIK